MYCDECIIINNIFLYYFLFYCAENISYIYSNVKGHNNYTVEIIYI